MPLFRQGELPPGGALNPHSTEGARSAALRVTPKRGIRGADGPPGLLPLGSRRSPNLWFIEVRKRVRDHLAHGVWAGERPFHRSFPPLPPHPRVMPASRFRS